MLHTNAGYPLISWTVERRPQLPFVLVSTIFNSDIRRELKSSSTIRRPSRLSNPYTMPVLSFLTVPASSTSPSLNPSRSTAHKHLATLFQLPQKGCFMGPPWPITTQITPLTTIVCCRSSRKLYTRSMSTTRRSCTFSAGTHSPLLSRTGCVGVIARPLGKCTMGARQPLTRMATTHCTSAFWLPASQRIRSPFLRSLTSLCRPSAIHTTLSPPKHPSTQTPPPLGQAEVGDGIEHEWYQRRLPQG